MPTQDLSNSDIVDFIAEKLGSRITNLAELNQEAELRWAEHSLEYWLQLLDAKQASMADDKKHQTALIQYFYNIKHMILTPLRKLKGATQSLDEENVHKAQLDLDVNINHFLSWSYEELRQRHLRTISHDYTSSARWDSSDDENNITYAPQASNSLTPTLFCPQPSSQASDSNKHYNTSQTKLVTRRKN